MLKLNVSSQTAVMEQQPRDFRKVYRSSHPEVIFKKAVRKTLTCEARPATLLKRIFNAGVFFFVKFAEILRAPNLKYICERLLLQAETMLHQERVTVAATVSVACVLRVSVFAEDWYIRGKLK